MEWPARARDRAGTPMDLRRARIVVWEPHKAVYIRVPKAANTSIRNSLGQGRSRRVWLAWLRRRYPDHLVFSFVRNPWSRLVSAYRHKILAEPVTDRYYLDGVHRGFVKWRYPFRAGMPFEEFAEFVCALRDAQAEKHLKSQSYFVVHRGLLVPAFIGRFETITHDWGELCRALGTSIELVRYNRTHGPPYPTYYTPRLVQLVGDRYREDIARFGYQFESVTDAATTPAVAAASVHPLTKRR